MRRIGALAPALVAPALALALLALPVSAPARVASRPSGPAARASWQHYLESPGSARVRPVRIVSTSGAVSDPQALVQPGSGRTTTLTYAPGGPAPTVVLDYGKEVGGYPEFAVAAVIGAPTMRSAYSETRAALTTTGDVSVTPAAFSSSEPNRYDDYTLTTPGPITNQYIQGGERYQLITLTSPGSVSLRSADIRFVGVIAKPQTMRGWFLSSSDLLNRIWYAGVYTVNLNQQPPGTRGVLPGEVSSTPLLLDGAKRDRGLWTGDQAISDLTVYDALDPAYAKGSIALIGEHPGTTASLLTPSQGDVTQPGPLAGDCAPFNNGPGCTFWSASYSMLYVLDLFEYYRYTGDVAFVRQEWPLVLRQMAWDAEQVDSSGLFQTSAADGADWNVDIHPGELTYVNAVYKLALDDAATLAQAIGERGSAAAYRASAHAVKAAVNAKLWDSHLGAYDASTSERGAVVQDANVFAILSGIAGGTRSHALVGVMARALASRFGALDTASPAPSGYTQTISPYIGGFQLQADFAAGRPDAALALIRSEWGWMVTHDPGGVDWEKIGLNGLPTAMVSTAHAWSTGATSALTGYVLGVLPNAPGFARLTVAPHPGNLAWARGRTPTPHGPVDVSWRRQRCGGFRLEVALPAGIRASVVWGHQRLAAARRGTYVLAAAASCAAKPGRR